MLVVSNLTKTFATPQGPLPILHDLSFTLARGPGQGQVRVNVQGRSRIVAASSNGPALAAFPSVKVLSVQQDNSLVVEPQP